MTYSKNAYRGKYIPKNPEKYVGDVSNISFRSSYERSFMKWCDMSDKVLQWGSEEIIIPYVSPLDNMTHRYFTDFVLKIRTKTGVKTYLVEVKPFRYTQEPVIPKRKTQNFLAEVKQWAVNQAKWDAAKIHAKKRGWEFMLITEKDLGLLR